MIITRCLRAILWIAAALPLSAADPWPLPLFTSDPKAVLEAADRRAASAETGVVILDLHDTTRFVAGGRIESTQRTVYRLINEAGLAKLNKISQVWPAWRADKPTIRARVITKDGVAHVLDPNTITEAGVPTQVADLYSDVKILTAPLPAVAPGAVVEAEIETHDRETVDPSGRLEQFSLFGDVPIQFLQIALEVPAGAPLHIDQRRMPKLERKETTSENVRRVELTASDVPTFKAIPLAPPEAAGNPAVLFSDVPDWQQVAKWYSGVVNRQIGVAAPVVDANSDAANRMPEIETILADVQKQVRYTGVELGYAAFEPRAPAETLTRGYGDCKDKATLLVSRLRKAGIASTLALLTPYPLPAVMPEVPGMEAFLHAIVYVPGKHPLWIDPTAEFAPASRLPLADQGRLALIVDPQTKELIRTPESKASDNRSLNDVTLTLSEEGKSLLEMAHEESGGAEDSARPVALAASQAPENRRESMMASLQQGVPGKFKSVDWGTPKDLSKPARLTVLTEDVAGNGSSGQAVYATVNGIGDWPSELVTLVVVLSAEKNEPEAKDRKEDYWLPAPFTSAERYRVVAPPGFRLKQLPEVSDLPYGPLTVQRKVSLDPDGSVLFAYRIESGRRFTPAQAKSLLEAAENTSIETFRVEFMAEGALLMSEGKWKEGIEILRRDAESASPKFSAMLRYADGLLEAGFRDLAITVCRKAIELDPKSARAYSRLSFLYRHDPAGRLDAVGNDIAQAEKAIRKAMELDPGDKQLVADLATVLEWKIPQGRYMDKVGLEEAIRLLDGISKDLQADELPTALFFARHFTELESFYSRPEAASSRSDLRIAAVAAAENPAAALQEAARLFPNEEDRKAMVRSAGEYLIGTGEYARAAGLLREGGSSNPQSDLEMLRRAHRFGEIKFSTNGAAAVVQRYILALFDQRSGLRYSDFLTTEWKDLAVTQQRTGLMALLNPFARFGGEQRWAAPISEIAMSNVDFFSEGNDAIGYRVRFTDPARNGARTTVAWVVKRGDSYKVLGLTDDQSTAGGEAFALAQRGDLAAARRWLDWEREEITVPSSTDPLAAEPFLKLWPPRVGVPERDQAFAAAASLVARGRYYRQGVEVLSAVRTSTQDRSFQRDIDLALAEGLSFNGECAQALSEWRKVHARYPMSELGFDALGCALVWSGRLDEALALAASAKPDDDLYAAAQFLRARVLLVERKYGEAIQAYQAACSSAKATAVAWNNKAWLTLFAPGVLTPDMDAANTANRMAQGGNSYMVMTLGSVQAETGQLKEARQSLTRYLGLLDPAAGINDPARYLIARIAEGLGLRETAEENYSAIARPRLDGGDDVYDLAQIRLEVMRQPK